MNRATQAREDTIIGQEKEQISLAWNSLVLDKTTGKISNDISNEEFAVKFEEELEKNGDNITVEFDSENDYYKVTFGDTGHIYSVDSDGKIDLIGKDGNVSSEGKITVTFDSNGGTIPKTSNKKWKGSGQTATKTLNSNSKYGELPIPTKDGYTFLGWSEKNSDYILPEEYQKVEYIESTGTQYIQTDIVPSDETGVHAKLETNDEDDGVYFGSRGNGDSRFWIGDDDWYGTNGKVMKVYYGWNDYKYYEDYYIKQNEIYTLQMNYLNDRKERFNDELVYDDIGTTELSSANTYPIYIFAANNAGTTQYKSSIKLYELKISEGSSIAHDFIPCYRKDSGIIGLYDAIIGIFYENKGSGTFIKGNNVETENNFITSSTQIIKNENHTLYAIWGRNPTITFNANGGEINQTTKTIAYNSKYGELPIPTRNGYTFKGWNYINPEYQKVEYIQFNGGQYIDTGIIPSNHMTEVKFNNSISSDMMLFSTSSGGSYYEFQTSGSKYYYGTNGTQKSGGSQTLNELRTVIYNGDNGLITVNGTEISTGNTINSSTNLMIGSRGTNSSYRFQGQIYYVKIIDKSSGELIRNLIPCYRKRDNVIGLYDSTNEVFYQNMGADVFTKGLDVANGTFNSVVDINYITSTTQVMTNANHTLYAVWEKN